MTKTPDLTESIFAAIAALPSVEARAAYLGESCATDPILRQRVEFLLRAHDRARLLLDRPITGGTEQTVAGVPHRYRAARTTAAAIGLLLLTGGAFSIWQAVRVTRAEMAVRTAEEEVEGSRAEAERQRARAEAGEKLAGERLAQVAAEKTRVEEERQVAQSVRDFLQNKLLGQADLQTQANALLRAGGFPAEAKQNPTIRELLDRGPRIVAGKDRRELSQPTAGPGGDSANGGQYLSQYRRARKGDQLPATFRRSGPAKGRHPTSRHTRHDWRPGNGGSVSAFRQVGSVPAAR